MNYVDAQLLLEFARLNLSIAAARDPAARITVSRQALVRSKGYRELRAMWVRMSDRAKSKYRRAMRMQIEGIRELERRATAAGETFCLADVKIELELIDDSDETSTDCPGSGQGITDPVGLMIRCSSCEMGWDPHSIGFRIPSHPPMRVT